MAIAVALCDLDASKKQALTSIPLASGITQGSAQVRDVTTEGDLMVLRPPQRRAGQAVEHLVSEEWGRRVSELAFCLSSTHRCG
jgi:hypothetical protein